MEEFVITCAFGAPKTLPINQALAQKVREFDLPVVTQPDIPLEPSDGIRIITHKGHLSTLALFIRVKKRFPQAQKVHIMTAKPHLWRAYQDAKRVFPSARIIPVTLWDIRPYSSESLQWYTRGPLRWWLREIPIRFLTITLSTVAWKWYKKLMGVE